MRMFATFVCLPFITILCAMVTQDFFVGIVSTVTVTFFTYLLWDKFFEYREEEKRTNNGND